MGQPDAAAGCPRESKTVLAGASSLPAPRLRMHGRVDEKRPETAAVRVRVRAVMDGQCVEASHVSAKKTLGPWTCERQSVGGVCRLWYLSGSRFAAWRAQSGPVAQLAEQQTLNLRVEGSIPSRLTSLRSPSASYGWLRQGCEHPNRRRLSAVAPQERRRTSPASRCPFARLRRATAGFASGCEHPNRRRLSAVAPQERRRTSTCITLPLRSPSASYGWLRQRLRASQ